MHIVAGFGGVIKGSARDGKRNIGSGESGHNHGVLSTHPYSRNGALSRFFRRMPRQTKVSETRQWRKPIERAATDRLL